MIMKSIKSIIILTGLFLTVSCGKNISSRKYTIQKGDFSASITQTGNLQALVANHIVMPFLGFRFGYRNKLVGLAEHGSVVEQGDSVIAIDPSNVMRYLVERENRLELEKANYEKTLVQHRTRAIQLKSQLQQQEASYNMEKLALEKSQFDSERNKQIRQLEFRKAEILLEKTRKNIEYNNRIAELDRIIQSTKVIQLENDTADSHHALTRLILRAPNDGIFQIAYNRHERQLYKVGDESYPNRSLASIPNLSRMKVMSTVNEIDIDKIKLGQKVIVRLDAFPDLEFQGEVTKIGKLSRRVHRESSIKVFDLEVLVEENDNEVLKPGMTVSCEIIYAELEDVFYVPNDCIMRENGQFFIHVSGRGQVVKTPVEIGARNNSHTVVYGEIAEGSEVIPKDRLAGEGA
jgi:hypothetical protein